MPPSAGDPVPELTLPARDGGTMRLEDLRGRPVLLTFLRHAGWLLCRAHLVKVLHHRERIEGAGGTVLAVGFEPLDRMIRGLDWPWPVLLDRERATYRRFGLARAPLTELLKPGGWLRGYVRELRQGNVRGALLARPGLDVLQLGGDFVIDRDGTVVLAHPSTGIDDREPVGSLVRALASA